MYEAYWNLKEMSFENTPDPRFLYRSKQHEESLMRMLYTIKYRKGGGVLTGVFGCGKTLLSQAILDELSQEKYKTAIISNPQLEYTELLRAIVRNLRSIELPQKKTSRVVIIIAALLISCFFNSSYTFGLGYGCSSQIRCGGNSCICYSCFG